MSYPGTFDAARSGGDTLYVRLGFKRLLDICVALVAIIFFLPVILLIGLALLWADGYPIHFRHQRIGRNGRSFSCLKFRTMVRDSDEQLRKLLAEDPAALKEWKDTHKLRNDPRIHPIGVLLRKSSLDELPQLLNVLGGDMSIVGPRPIVTEEMTRYEDKFAVYSSVRPGVSGLWQVGGRSGLSYAERVNLDVHYVETISLTRDLQILFKTALVVATGRGSA
jgi:exopolysaccharide production protein ExoY